MRAVSCLLAVVVFAFWPALGRAVTIRVQDPNYVNLTGSPTSFMFVACPGENDPGGPYLDNGAVVSADGCFGGLNQTQSSITSIVLTFQNTPAVQRSTVPDAAFSDIFQNATFTPPADPSDSNAFYTFTFSGGEVFQRQAFVITEDGVPYGAFPTVGLTFTTSSSTVTPEPSSILLLGTSLLFMGAMYRRFRVV